MQVARWVYVALLVTMATGQLVDFPAFRDIIHTYDFAPEPLMDATAVLLIGGEAGAAGLLARRSTAVLGGLLMLVVALAWSLLAVQAFARGLELENCGCFGRFLAQELRWWVLLQDAVWLAAAVLLVRRQLSSWARRLVTGPVAVR
jgi:hypothetical protein